MGWLLVPIAVTALAVGWWRLRRGMARLRRLMLLCREAGLEFVPLDLFPDTAWLPFPMFGYAQHGTESVVWDRSAGEAVRAFDYWYKDPASQGPAGARRRFTCAIVPLPFSGPRLRVAPRSHVDDVSEALKEHDVRFEHEVRLELEEFDRRFRVQTGDAQFAVAFLDQRMMEAVLGLLAHVVLDVNEDALLLWAPLLPAEQVRLLLDAALAIQRRIPRVVASLYPPRPARAAHERRWLQGRWSPESTGTPPS